MPNITIFIPADKMPVEEVLADLSSLCSAICTGILQAAQENVHVIYVPMTQGYGHPVFAEVQYRLEPFRLAPVMEQFMGKLDDAIRRHTGLTARIRCFGHAAPNIYARN